MCGVCAMVTRKTKGDGEKMGLEMKHESMKTVLLTQSGSHRRYNWLSLLKIKTGLGALS